MNLTWHKRIKPRYGLENAGRSQGTDTPQARRGQERSGMERERVGWFAKANLGRKLRAWQGVMAREQSVGCWLALKSNRRAVWVLAATSDLLNGEPEGGSWDGGGKKGQEFE